MLRLVPLTMYFTGFPRFSGSGNLTDDQKKRSELQNWQMCPPLEKGRRNVCIQTNITCTQRHRMHQQQEENKESLMGREGQEAWEDNQGATRAFKLHWGALIVAFYNYAIFLYYTVFAIFLYYTAIDSMSQNCTAGKTTLFSHSNFYPWTSLTQSWSTHR